MAEEWFLCVSLCFALAVSAEGLKITATAGQDATLPCPAEEFLPLDAVEWSRPATDTQYVLVFRMPNPKLEIPELEIPELEIPEQRYQGRVELKNLRNGDVSLVLRGVTAADGGTYECHVGRERKQSKGATRLIRTIYLEVLPLPTGATYGGSEDGGNLDWSVVSRGSVIAAVAGIFTLMALLAAIAVIRWKKGKNLRSSSENPPINPLKEADVNETSSDIENRPINPLKDDNVNETSSDIEDRPINPLKDDNVNETSSDIENPDDYEMSPSPKRRLITATVFSWDGVGPVVMKVSQFYISDCCCY